MLNEQTSGQKFMAVLMNALSQRDSAARDLVLEEAVEAAIHAAATIEKNAVHGSCASVLIGAVVGAIRARKIASERTA